MLIKVMTESTSTAKEMNCLVTLDTYLVKTTFIYGIDPSL